MKSIIFKSVFLATLVLLSASAVIGQRIIKGTVYKEGKPAAGFNVEVHKSSKVVMTSFDGQYQVDAEAGSKWIKFTELATDEFKKEDISTFSGDVFDCYFDGVKPAAPESATSGVILKTIDELKKEQNTEVLSEYSLYQQFYEQRDFRSAQPHWERLYNEYPKISKNIYIHGATMIEHQIESAKTREEKEKLLQKSMELHDRRIKYFGQEGYVLGRKASSWLKFYVLSEEQFDDSKRKDVLKKGYEWASQSIKLQGVETETTVFILFIRTSVTLFQMGELSKETVVANYDLSSKLLSEIKAKAKPDEVEKVKLSIDVVEQIFGASGAADCEALISIYEPQFGQNSGDAEWIKSMLRKLKNANCDESELYSSATEKLFQLDPSPEAAYNMARRFLRKDDIEKAKEYYKLAMEHETDQQLLKVYYYEYGLTIFAKEGALQEARNYANKALAIDPNYCKALMLIGDIYATANQSFGSDAFEKSTVFWVAVDYYNKAARSGDECMTDASQKIADYKKFFPNKEEAFYRQVTEGENYKVGGWINENTKVRF